MSDDRGRRSKKRDYEVGYGKPPKESQFPPGVSGNPRGRPRGSKNVRPALREDKMAEIISREANRKIDVRENGQMQRTTMAEAAMRSLAVKAAQGHRLHQKLFFELYSQSEASQRERDQGILADIIAYKSWAEREIERCKATGEKPDLMMHPDDIHIDMETGEFTYTGPTKWDRKTEERKWRARIAAQKQEIANLERELEKTEDPEMRRLMEKDLEEAREILSWLTEKLGTRNQSQRSRNN